ncbi:MAG: peptidase C15 [Roseofilum sp. Belize BBD 4]|uniref:pyroglutamyl-peptidase I family protein n=1 Tax=Roseofilum sp. Belize BBD 4 TaxID=2821500 RepID=UPI000E917590|nr:peptidase C15 [Roseofilum sp. Belize BBD 4]MBP0032724.1 peptidase C15 [Roseofilum sp. Belize BBD 4]HBQ98867.1 peptidase C15 [Cyanobacteria bacterium UBA11691]
MIIPFLLTSFTTWKPHQNSNSSDDLLEQIGQSYPYPERLSLLRKLPVDSQPAIAQTLFHLHSTQPAWVLCCGMAEKRDRLSIESNATQKDKILRPAIDLELLIRGLDWVYISDYAGRFVCEDLYYRVLQEINTLNLPTRALFIHVPILHPDNEQPIINSFVEILHRLECQ